MIFSGYSQAMILPLSHEICQIWGVITGMGQMLSGAKDVLADCKLYQMNGYIQKPIRGDQAAQLLEHFVCHKDVKIDDMIFIDE